MQENGFNDIHKTGGRTLINAEQLQSAESFVKQLVKMELSVLRDLTALKSSERKAVKSQMHHLYMHTLTVLHHQVVYSSQLERVLNQVQFKMRKFMIIERFINIRNLVLRSVREATLSSDQISAAVSNITSLYQYVHGELLKVQKLSAFRSIFTGGINAMNGALAKYISESQMYILNQIQSRTDYVKRSINHQPRLSVIAKYMASRRVTNTFNEAKQELMTTNNFIGLSVIKNSYLKKLQRIVSDKNQSLKNIKAFTKFTNHLTSYITRLSSLSIDARLNLKARIIRSQRSGLTHVQRSNQQFTDFELNTIEYQLAVRLILAVGHSYQHKIDYQDADLITQQRKTLKHYLKQAVDRDVKELPKNSSIEVQIKKILYNLNQQAFKKENQMLYQNRIHKVVNEIRTRINDQYNLTSATKNNLKVQIAVFIHRICQKRVGVQDIRQHLHNWLKIQIRYHLHSSLSSQVNSLYQQIKLSNLPAPKKQSLLGRLVKINKTKSDYHDKSSLVRNINDYGLSLDKSVNLHKLTSLNDIISHQIQTFNISSTQGKHLSYNFVEFSQQINDLKCISTVDHLEQGYENRIYSYLCQPKLDRNPLVIKALRFPIDQAKETCRQMNLMVLDRSLSLYIDDRINRRLCSYLNLILRTSQRQSIKPRLTRIVHDIKSQSSWALSWVKQCYIHQISDSTLNMYYQLYLYSVNPQKMLDRMERINSQISGNINNSENLMRVEHFYQKGKHALNTYSSQIIGRIDQSKAKAYRSVDYMASVLHHQLQDRQIKSVSTEIKEATLNRILDIINQIYSRISRRLNDNVSDDLQWCQKTLNHVLRQSYVQEWLKVSGQAQLSIQRLVHVPVDPKMMVLHFLQERETKIADQLKECNKAKLSRILRSNEHYIYQAVRHGVYLNPAKKNVRNKIDQLIVEIKANLTYYTDGKVKSQSLKRLNDEDVAIDRQILDSDDQQLKSLYDTERQRLITLEIKSVRRTQLRHFNVYVKKIEHQLHQLKFISNHAAGHADDKFNRYYHQFIYKITHASALHTCVSNEQKGEKQFRQVLVGYRKVDHDKHKLCQNIIEEVQSTSSEINSLENLQKRDKRDSYHLLKQIQQHSVQSIKVVDSVKQSKAILKEGHAMIKQVVDKISSAGVLASAIKTANHQIADSTLNPQQKKVTLRQINQIIASGIKKQFNSHDKSVSKKKDSKSKLNDSRKSDKDKSTSQTSPNKTKPNKGKPSSNKKSRHSFFSFFNF